MFLLFLFGCVTGWAQGLVVSWSSLLPPHTMTHMADVTGAEDFWTAHYGVALRKDGTVSAWGSAANHARKELPPGLSGIKAVAGGRNFCVALRDDGTVIAWGGGSGSEAAVVPPGLAGVDAIAAGGYHALALQQDGTVTAWGRHAEGQCDVPAGLDDVVAIAAGLQMSAALRRDGTVVCWGQDLEGQPIATPAGLSAVTKLAAGDGVFLVARQNGSAGGWGTDWEGFTVPWIPGQQAVVEVAGGINESLGVLRNGRILTHRAYHPLPLQPAARARVIGQQFYTLDRAGRLHAGGPNTRQLGLHGKAGARIVSAGHWHSAVVYANGRVTIAGERRYTSGRPQRFPSKAPDAIKAVSGQNFDVALLADGTVAAVGFHEDEQPPPDLRDVVDIDTGNNHAIALKSDGTVVTWGQRSHLGSRLDVPPELRDPATAQIKAVAATSFFCAALQEGGRLFVWGGASWEGPLDVPTALPDDVADLEGGDRHLLGLRADGTVLGWGDAGAGQIDIPAGLADVTAISAGGRNSLALKKDGTVVAWGAERTVPPGLTNVTAISSGPYHSIALVGEAAVKKRR